MFANATSLMQIGLSHAGLGAYIVCLQVAELSESAGVRHQLLLISCCDPICSRPSLHVVRGTSSFRIAQRKKKLGGSTPYQYQQDDVKPPQAWQGLDLELSTEAIRACLQGSSYRLADVLE